MSGEREIDAVPHGHGGYTNHGCRCGICRQAATDWQRAKRRDRAAALILNPSIAEHGSSSTYANYLCRCQPCRDAHTAARREQLRRARDRRATPGRDQS